MYVKICGLEFCMFDADHTYVRICVLVCACVWENCGFGVFHCVKVNGVQKGRNSGLYVLWDKAMLKWGLNEDYLPSAMTSYVIIYYVRGDCCMKKKEREDWVHVKWFLPYLRKITQIAVSFQRSSCKQHIMLWYYQNLIHADDTCMVLLDLFIVKVSRIYRDIKKIDGLKDI